MIAIRVCRGQGASPATPPDYRDVVRGPWRITLGAGPPLGHADVGRDRVLVAEGFALEDGSLAQAAMPGARLPLPETAQSAVGFDATTGRARLAASIRGGSPLYVHTRPDGFVAATTLGALRDLGVDLAEDERHTGEVLVYRYVAPPATLCRGVDRLVGGETRDVDLVRGTVVRSHRSLPAPDPGRIEEAAALDGVEAAIEVDLTAARADFRAPGLLLSGGLDSGLLGVLAGREGPPLPTWSSGFGFLDTTDREQVYATTMATHLGTRHHAHTMTRADYLRNLVEAVVAAEAPLHHLQSVALHALFRDAAATGIDALWCGEGADGLFGTDVHHKLRKYRRMLGVLHRSHLDTGLRLALRLTRGHPDRVAWFGLRFQGPPRNEDPHLLWTLGEFGDPRLVRERFRATLAEIHGQRAAILAPYMHLPLLQKLSVFGLLTEADATLCVWSRLAAAHGIALLAPYTRPAAIDAVLRIPWQLRCREPKAPVRALLRRHGVPDSLIDRPKLGFGLPYRHWATPGGLFDGLVALAEVDHDPGLLRSLQGTHPDRAMVLWGALQLWLWRKLVLEGADGRALADELVARDAAAA
jgi:asparagine synthase (glutamine-hydrolysing)